MFKKGFTVKSNSNVKNSDRRKLLARFPIGSEYSSKSTLSLAKITTSNGHSVNLYSCDKDPILFEIQDDKNLFPTVYFVWISPSTVPVLLIPPNVMEFIEKGADLMLPGVILPPDYLFPEFEKNAPVAVGIYYRDTETFSTIAIGASILSSAEMISCGMKGKGVNILHTYQDSLWEFGSKTRAVKIPISRIYKRADFDDIEKLEELEIVDSNEENVQDIQNEEKLKENTTQEMDELLTNVFLWTLKTNGSSIQLPIDVGQFYANYILKQLPSEIKIDLKKTSFKKFINFLKKINENESILKIINKKGVDSIHEINLENDSIKNAQALEGIKLGNDSGIQKSTDHPRLSECFSATEAVVPILKGYGFKKGDTVQSNQLREIIIQYGMEKKLLSDDKKKIELDDTLQTLIRHFLPDKVLVNDLVQKIGGQMTKAFVVTFPDGRKNVIRNKMPFIQFNVEKRSGNKTVTLLSNTAFFGIDANAFCKKIQTALATGASISQEVANCDGPQILLHGNHVFYIGELLQNEYGIQKKYIKGLELGVKPKKSKR